MKKSCLSVNVFTARNLTDSLNGYVVLAFFVSLLLTIVFVLLLIKYIMLNISKEKEREKHRTENKGNRLRKEEESLSSDDSEYDFEMDDYESEIEDDHADILSSTSLKSLPSVDSPNEELETNIISKIKKDEEKPAIQIIYNQSKLLEFHQRHDVQYESVSYDANSLLKEYFSYFHLNKTQYNSTLLNKYIIHIMDQRKQIIKSSIQYLFQQSSQDTADVMHYNSKYDQLFDEADTHHDILQHTNFLSMVKEETSKDLLVLNLTKNIDELLDLVFSTPSFLILKQLHSQFDTFLEKDCEVMMLVFTVILDINKTLSTYKVRYLKFTDSLLQLNNNHTVVSAVDTFKQKVVQVISNMELHILLGLNEILCSSTKVKDIEVLKTKQEKEIKQLFCELLATNKSKSNLESLKSYQTFLFELLSQQYEELCNVTNQTLIKNICSAKATFSGMWKIFMQSMSEEEESILNDLENQSSITEEQIVKLINQVQQTLKSAKEESNNQKLEILKQSKNFLNKERQFLGAFIEIIIKKNSSEVKYVREVITKSITSFPGITVDSQTKVASNVNKSLSFIVFDLTLVLLKDLSIIIGVSGDTTSENSIFKNLLESLQNDTTPADFLNIVTFSNILSPKHNYMERINVHQLTLEYFKLIKETIWENIETLVKKELQTELSVQITSDFNKLYNLYVLLMNSISNDNKTYNTTGKSSNNNSYLSRKGSSLKEMTHDENITELYFFHKRMRDNKINEYYERKSQGQSLINKKKVSTQQLLEHQMKLFIEKLSSQEDLENIYNIENHFMFKILTKKIELQNKEEEVTVDDDVNHDVKMKKKKLKEKSKIRKSRKVSSIL